MEKQHIKDDVEHTRSGDPLDGLWTWRDHPLAGVGIALAIMGASLIIFPLLAQVMF